MAHRANFWKKLKRIISKLIDQPSSRKPQSAYSQQIGKLMKNRGNEIVTMVSL